jgi:hypothetical protein
MSNQTDTQDRVVNVQLTAEQVKTLKDFIFNEGWRGDKSGTLSDIYRRLFWAELRD